MAGCFSLFLRHRHCRDIKDSAGYTEPWLFFCGFISDISQRLALVECPSPQPSPRVRGEGAWPGVELTRLIKLAVAPEAA